MSDITTCAVKAIVHESEGGIPAVGATVEVQLSYYDIYEGFVAPEKTVFTTDANGEVVMDLFPNQLGQAASFYEVKIKYKNKTFRSIAVVPNTPTALLHEITDIPPYEGQPTGALLLAQMLILVTEAAGSASAAAASATAAGASATAAATSATAAAASQSAAATSATAASGSATAASTSAGNAATSAAAAAASQSAAATSETNAATSAGTASAAAISATASQGAAATSATNAATSAAAAGASEATALSTLAVFDDVPPAAPLSGRRWTSEITGKTYEWIVDADGGQWVETGSAQTVAATAFAAFLATAGGSAAVGYQQDITDSVLLDAQIKLRQSLSVIELGADASGVNDAAPKIQKAADGAGGRVLTAVGTFRIASALNLRNVNIDFRGATLVLDAGAPSVVIGGNAASTVNPRQEIPRAYRSGGATATPTLRVAGTKNQFIDVGSCDYLQLYADTATAPTTDGSIAYCTLNLGKIDKLEITNNPANVGAGTGVGGSIQWINENVFNLQRCVEFIVSGTYQHNHNRVFGGTFEGTSTINFLAGWDNYIYDARFEGTPTVTFAAGTERNIVINTWDSSTSNFASTATVADSGFDNVCMDDFLLYRHEQTLAYADLTDVVLDTQVTPVATPRARDLQRIYTTTVTQKIVNARVGVDAGDYFRWVAIGPTGSNADTNARYRPRIEFFDAKLQPVTASADFILTTGGVLSSVSGNTISAGTNVSGAVAAILPAAITAGVRFVAVSWLGNSPSTASISTATQMHITQLVKKSDTFRGAALSRGPATGSGVLVSGIPTQGFAPAGWMAIKSDASAKYVNKFEFETTSTATAAASDTVILVTAKTGVLVGDVAGVNLDDGSTHWTTVSSISTAGQISLVAGLPSASASGSRLVFNRWLTIPGIASAATIAVTTTLTSTSSGTQLVNAAGGAIVVNLPTAASASGQIFNIKKIDSSANTVTIDPNGAETIDGAATFVLTAQYQNIQIQSNGTAWYVL